jgi:uncharacterized membrane protein
VRRGVQLVVAAEVFPIAGHVVSQDIINVPAQKMQLHQAINSIYFLLDLVGVVLRYLG